MTNWSLWLQRGCNGNPWSAKILRKRPIFLNWVRCLPSAQGPNRTADTVIFSHVLMSEGFSEAGTGLDWNTPPVSGAPGETWLTLLPDLRSASRPKKCQVLIEFAAKPLACHAGALTSAGTMYGLLVSLRGEGPPGLGVDDGTVRVLPSLTAKIHDLRLITRSGTIKSVASL